MAKECFRVRPGAQIARNQYGRYNQSWRIVQEEIMSQVYNPEADVVEAIERLKLEARNARRKIEHARTESDKRVLNRQMQELQQEIDHLQARLP